MQRFHRGLAIISTLANGVPELMGTVSLSKPAAANNCRHSAAGRQCSCRKPWPVMSKVI
jgi:hypothetical protein